MKSKIAIFLLLLGAPALASAARVGVGIGVNIGGPVWYGGPGWYGAPYYYAPYYYGPSYAYYPPAPAVVYAPPVTVVTQPPASFWYYCVPAKAYYPYVRECPIGWQAVPATRAMPQAPAMAAAPAPAGKVTYRLGDVLFETAKSDLRPGAVSTLDTMLASLQKEPGKRIVIEGHTDSEGGVDFNLGLSQRRAEAVRQYLIAHGIAAERITAIGKGESTPIADNHTAEGRRLNRRVDITVG